MTGRRRVMSCTYFRKFSWIAVAFFVGSSLALGQSPAPVTAQQNAPHILKIPDGTIVRLSLLDNLSSATTENDEPVNLEVSEDVKVGDVVAIPRGATARGHVVEVEERRRLGRAGKLNFSLDYVKAPDGTNVRLRASSARKGEDKTGTVIIGSVVLSPLFMIMRGKDVNIPKGTSFNAYVDGDREITFGGPPAAASAASPTQSSAQQPTPRQVPSVLAEEPATIAVKSTPAEADITVDGKYAGSTPSTLRLPPGDHDVSIAKSGFKPWLRKLTLTAGSSPTISATLEEDFVTSPAGNSTKPRAELGSTEGSPSAISDLGGSYAGEVTNTTLGVSAPFALEFREESGGIYGCTTVQKPLEGSGGLQGTVNGSKVLFEATGKKLHIRFIGELQGDTLKGSFTVLSTQEHGNFQVRRVDSKAPPIGFNPAQCRKD
jgi:hypothetical protein